MVTDNKYTFSRLLTVREVADILAVNPKTIYQWASEGFLPSHKTRGAVRFHPEDVQTFITRHRRNGNPSPYKAKIQICNN